jgi:orotate phosphoribosyltransferase
MFLVGHLVFERLLPGIDVVGGLTFGADPIAVSTAFVSELRQRPVRAISIRKARKEHGTMRWIEGDVQAGESVAIVEDVVTTGGSTLRAVERAREEGLRVVQVIALVDRQEGGLEAIGRQVSSVTAIVTRAELEARLAAG